MFTAVLQTSSNLLYLPEIKQYDWITVPKLFAAKALGKDRTEKT